jgi:mono/diheme cytochrome c family protein
MPLPIREDYTVLVKTDFITNKRITMTAGFIIASLAAGVMACAAFFNEDPLTASVGRGKTVYKDYCMSCHMPEGQGLDNTFPPLAKTGRLTDKRRLVQIVFNGLSGAITVKGKQYNQEMMPLNLTDQEAMDVLNFIRNSWGNKAPLITIKEVEKFKPAVQ